MAPAYIFIGISVVIGKSRFDKIEIYAKLISVLSLIFLTFIRWPFEGAMVSGQGMEDGGDIGVEEQDTFVIATPEEKQ